jgi:WD40 repeat protein
MARLGRWCRRNPTLASLGGLVLSLATTLVVGSVAATINSRQAADELRAEARVADARVVRFGDRLGRREQSRRLLSEAASLRPGPQVRDEAIAGMALFDLPVVGLGPQISRDHWAIDFDGQLARYAESSREGLITVSGVTDNAEICRIPEQIPTAMLMLSPDGKYLATRSGPAQVLSVWSLEGGVPHAVHRELCHGDYGIGAFHFSLDNRRFAIGRPDGTVSIRSLPSGELQREWKFDAGAQHLAFHPVRPQIAIAGRDPVQIRDYETGRLAVRLEDTAGATWVVWHPAGKLLATADSDLGISLWEADEFRRHRKLRGHDNNGIQMSFNSSGTMLCSLAWDALLQFWDPFDGSLLFSSRTEGVFALGGAALRPVWPGGIAPGRIGFWQSDAHEVYSRLSAETLTADGYYRHLAISPQGMARNRLLAVATPQGVRFWDLATRRCVGLLPAHAVGRVQFDGAGTLWTNSPAGIQRWPIEESPGERGKLVVGPALSVLPAGTDGDLAVTSDGRTIAIGGTSGSFVWHAEKPDFRRPLEGHYDPRYAAVSPDARWIATGSHTGTQVKIWDLHTEKLVRELPMKASRVNFSPDGAWLATTGGGLTVWSVGNWNQVWQSAEVPVAGLAFSPDGRTVAIGAAAGVVVLYEAATGREVARLTDPKAQSQIFLVFSPDQHCLTGISYDFKSLCQWDLHEIDGRLEALGIPWDWPSSRALRTTESSVIPLRIEVPVESRSAALERQLAEVTRQLGDGQASEALLVRRGWLLSAVGRPAEAVQELTQAIDLAANAATYNLRAHAHAAGGDYAHAIGDAASALGALAFDDPRQGAFCNHLAWCYVTAPPDLRRSEEATRLARRALRIEPGRAAYLNTLGVAQCLSGEWDEALDVLHRSLRAGSHPPACDRYYMALCHHHLHHPREAVEAFEQAIYWHDIHSPELDHRTRRELVAMRREVGSVLGHSADAAGEKPVADEIRSSPASGQPLDPVPQESVRP